MHQQQLDSAIALGILDAIAINSGFVGLGMLLTVSLITLAFFTLGKKFWARYRDTVPFPVNPQISSDEAKFLAGQLDMKLVTRNGQTYMCRKTHHA